jgi:hypothetical protein
VIENNMSDLLSAHGSSSSLFRSDPTFPRAVIHPYPKRRRSRASIANGPESAQRSSMAAPVSIQDSFCYADFFRAPLAERQAS